MQCAYQGQVRQVHIGGWHTCGYHVCMGNSHSLPHHLHIFNSHLILVSFKGRHVVFTVPMGHVNEGVVKKVKLAPLTLFLYQYLCLKTPFPKIATPQEKEQLSV